MLSVNGGLQDTKVKKLFIIGVAVITLLVAVAGYLLWQYLVIKNDPAAANKETITRITGQVGNMLHIPADEVPEVAQVTDPDKLKDQPFFIGVQKDDYVIVYQKAKFAILYREREHKLINVDHVELTPVSSTN